MQLMLNFFMKNILLCVIGVTPQIITETIYALYKRNPPVFIDELFIITTSKGADHIKETILEKKILEKLIKDYNLPPIEFNPGNIIIIKSPEDRELSDIRTTKDNELTGNIITETVRRLTQKDDTILHCSIAGGRKTMGYYLGSALQMYGRKQDRLYHVLVSEQFENNPQFFYPPPVPQKLKIRDRNGEVREISTSEAEIELAELPFLRLRDFVDFGDMSFQDLIVNTQKEIDSAVKLPPLKFFYREKTVSIGKEIIKLTPKLWEIYFYFALQKKKNCVEPSKSNCNDCDKCFIPIKSDASAKGLLDVFSINELALRSSISKIRTEIKKQMQNKELAVYYMIESKRRYGNTRYGILVDKTKILIQMEAA